MKQYMAYVRSKTSSVRCAVEDNNSSYNRAMWVLVSVLIAVLVVIIAVRLVRHQTVAYRPDESSD
ncbi:hypothetical protein KCP74_01730 [Salmonella enterica subsp. enterica]|nr:hypothetical protein KCP74_01730 [Salmonella enterica subsp. enterica]